MAREWVRVGCARWVKLDTVDEEIATLAEISELASSGLSIHYKYHIST